MVLITRKKDKREVSIIGNSTLKRQNAKNNCYGISMQEKKTTLLQPPNITNDRAFIKQLEREILYLERQLSRLQIVNSNLDNKTFSTYQEMISSRKDMLNDLGV